MLARDVEPRTGTAQPNRASIRRSRTAYQEPGSAWLVTIAFLDRRPLLADPIVAGAIAAVWIEVTEANGVSPDVYCPMPDHVHAIVQVSTGDVVSTIPAFNAPSTRLCIE